MSLKKSYVALAWTRPVLWTGFDRLSSDIDAAAAQSRTIRYQWDLIQRYVQEVQAVLEKEVGLLELAPDRATPESLKILKDLVTECSFQATFLSVDFTAVQGWRPQPALHRDVPVERCLTLALDPLLMDGKLFDPQVHFRAWRQKEKTHAQSRPKYPQAVLPSWTVPINESDTTQPAGVVTNAWPAVVFLKQGCRGSICLSISQDRSLTISFLTNRICLYFFYSFN